MDESLTLAEVSALTKIPQRTLRYWRHVGQGPPSYLVGARIRYDRAALEQWWNAQREATRSDRPAANGAPS